MCGPSSAASRSPSTLQSPTGYRNHLTRDPCGAFRGEENHGLGDVRALGPAQCRDKMRARIAASSGQFALNREISVCAGLRGGAGRTRTSNQTVIAETRVNQRSPH
jgi:hypothetical protein